MTMTAFDAFLSRLSQFEFWGLLIALGVILFALFGALEFLIFYAIAQIRSWRVRRELQRIEDERDARFSEAMDAEADLNRRQKALEALVRAGSL
jgi:hypothetical protein